MNFPDRFTFQWHLTDKCNLRCKHCYQESYTDNGPNTEQFLNYLKIISNFVSKISENKPNFKTHINFTGGEPFLKENFIDILSETKSLTNFSFAILSNGYLIGDNEIIRLKNLKPEFIQLSLEGNESVNDKIRGKGSYQSVIEAIKQYKKLGIPVLLSFTANSLNYKYFSEVVKVAKKYGVEKVWTDRYLPIDKNDDLQMSTSQVKEFFDIILMEQANRFRIFGSKTNISSGRALQFLTCGGLPYKCSAGVSLLAIMPNGDVLPCRRMPFKLGTLSSDNLIDLYINHDFLKKIRNPEKTDSECKKCFYSKSCNGGLKCLSFANYHDANRKDPNCWI